MKNKQTKAAILQWLIPVIILLAVFTVMLLNFSTNSNRSAVEAVEDTLINVVEKYALKVKYELEGMADVGEPIGCLMGKCVDSDRKSIVGMAEALCDNSEAYAVIYCRGDIGILQDGRELSVSELSYYPKIMGSEQDDGDMKASGVGEIRYIFTPDDEIGTGNRAIVAVINIDNCKKLLMYYPTEKLAQLFKKTEFDMNAFYSVIKPDGSIIERIGTESEFLSTDNIWDNLKLAPEYESLVVKTMIKMKNKAGGSVTAEVKGEARKLVFVPVGINDWTLVMGVKKTYVDNQCEREWADAKMMMYQMLAAVLVFIATVIVINIVNKIKNSEKSKELEEKADTDLLTGLSNKLATERKIKEYMENCSGEQGLMFVLDIDNFKKINDTLGHAFGDEVLRTLGHQMGAIFRATDVVGRTGGDEFTIFLKHLNDEELLEKEAKKLCDFFKNFQAGEYVKYAATASIGAAIFPKDGADFDTLYRAADNALYTAKKRGKSQLAFYGDENEKSEGKKRVEAESRKDS